MSESRDAVYGSTSEGSPARAHLISEALAPVYEATSSDTANVKPAVDWLIAEAQRALKPTVVTQVTAIIERLSELAEYVDAAPVGGAQENVYTELAEDVFLVRGLIANPETALALLDTRRYLQSIDVPETLPDLRLDESAAREKLGEMADLIQRAQQATRRSLPAGEEKPER